MSTLFDNSILVEIRAPKDSAVCVEKIEFVEKTFKKLQLRPEDAFLTDRLFVEMIGHGKVRGRIEEENKEFFEEWRKRISEVLLEGDKTHIRDVIDRYILALEKLFSCAFENLFSREKIYSVTFENVEQYKFASVFNCFEFKLIDFAKKLKDSESDRQLFIKSIVEDSVIRYLLDSVDIRQIKPKLYADVFDFLNQGLRALMIKYNAAGILRTNLNLLMSVLKDNIEAQLKPGQKSSPLFRVHNDLADPELGYFPIHGKVESGLLVPVTVVTKEPRHRVEERLKYNFQAVGTKADVIGPQELMTGRTIILNFENQTYQEIITKEYIQKKFKFASGKSIF